MMKLSQSNNQITIRATTTFLGVGVGLLALTAAGMYILFELLPSENDYTVADVLGLIFVCIWLLIVLGLGVFSLAAYCKTVIIDNNGISSKTWLNKKSVKWSDIQDWGLSYCRTDRIEGNTYHLYFSERECLAKNDCRKKLKGNMIKTFIVGEDYSEAVSRIIPYCAEKTDIPPFIGKDKYHFFR